MPPNLASQLQQQLPLFFGLKPSEIRLFLEICKTTKCEPGEILCDYGTASRRFFILLEGALEVTDKDGALIARVRPVTSVGETGFINKRPRSATVRVIEPSQLLRIEHHDFEPLMDNHGEFRSRMYRNMVRVLSDRLNDVNDLMVKYRKLYEASQEVIVEENGDAEKAPTASPAGETQNSGVTAETDRQEASSAEDASVVHGLVQVFYELLDEAVDSAQLARDSEELAALRASGHSESDIEYAVKWTASNIPTARRFSMVRLSIEEALEARWSS